MPSLKAIRQRIASTKSTQKITRAMKMISAARLRRAQQAIVELRPYARKTAEVLASIAARSGGDEADEESHPLLVQRPAKRVLLVVLTSDRGLAGAFNSSIQRAVERQARELADTGHEVALATLGRKGREYFKRRTLGIRHDFTGAYEGGAARAAEIARQLIADFTAGEVDQVHLVYNEFKSAISQKVTFQQLLPIRPEAAPATTPAVVHGVVEGGARTQVDFIYEPSKAALLDRLLPMYVEVTVFRAMLESVASEHGARMTAMDNATKNAKKMIDSLTLVYNRARQAAITKELMEIIGGAEALKE